MAKPAVSTSSLNGYVQGKLERLGKERSLLQYILKLAQDNLVAIEEEIKETLDIREVVGERLLSMKADTEILETIKQLKENNEKKG